jgi:hypothetical protein
VTVPAIGERSCEEIIASEKITTEIWSTAYVYIRDTLDRLEHLLPDKTRTTRSTLWTSASAEATSSLRLSTLRRSRDLDRLHERLERAGNRVLRNRPAIDRSAAARAAPALRCRSQFSSASPHWVCGSPR